MDRSCEERTEGGDIRECTEIRVESLGVIA